MTMKIVLKEKREKCTQLTAAATFPSLYEYNNDDVNFKKKSVLVLSYSSAPPSTTYYSTK